MITSQMTPVAEAQRSRRALFVGSRLRCPKDKQLRDVLVYKAFERQNEFQDELNVVLKCPDCGHIFSPGLSDVELQGMTRSNGSNNGHV